MFLLSVLVGYHQDQIAADSVLAGKVPLPPLVQVQDFDRSQHSNMLREVRLLGEAAIDQAIIVDLGSGDSHRLVQVVPIYPVTEMSAPMAIWYLRSIYDAVRRPVPRSAHNDIAAAHRALARIERTAIGLLISEDNVSDNLNIVGSGLNGPLVTILGAETGGSEIRAQTRQSLAGRGVDLLENLPVFVLYAAGQRPRTPVQDFSAPRRVLETIALALLAIGALKMFVPFHLGRRARHEKFEEVEAVGEFPRVFEPVHAQEESIRREQDASEQHAARTRRVATRAV